MAVASPLVSTAVIEANEFPDLIDRYAVSGVPKTVVDDRIEILGALAEDIFVPHVLQPPEE